MGHRMRKGLLLAQSVLFHDDRPTIWRQPYRLVTEEDRTPRDRSLRGKARVKARKAANKEGRL